MNDFNNKNFYSNLKCLIRTCFSEESRDSWYQKKHNEVLTVKLKLWFITASGSNHNDER